MKLLPVLPYILSAGFAISQVSASSLIVVVGNDVEVSGGFNGVGNHPHIPHFPHAVTKAHGRHKHGCGGSIRNKFQQVSNWFLVTFHIRPTTSDPSQREDIFAQPFPYGRPKSHVHHTLVAERPHQRTHKFVHRLTHALRILGPWEGRAVAFILGCGIGVLIRMFWVLAVLAVRSIRGNKPQREEFNEDEVLFDEEEHLLSPPQYVEEIEVVRPKEKDSA